MKDSQSTSLTARIEQLPFSRFHVHVLMMGGLGFSFEGLDLSIVAFVLPILKVQWALTSVEVGFLGSAIFIGFFFGAMFAGIIGDLIGRRAVMMYALVFYCVASFGCATSSNFNEFMIWRTLAGIGCGAESAIIAPFLSEFVAKRYRGRFLGVLTGFFAFGFIGAALLGYLVLPQSPDAWRYVIAGTGLPVLMLLWWRRALPESPRWLISVGRYDEATQVIERMEASAGKQFVGKYPPVRPVPAGIVPAARKRGSVFGQFRGLLAPKMLRTTVMCWTLWTTLTFCYYAFFTWIPSLLVESGMTITKSFGYSLTIYIAQLPGFFSAAYMNERIGRRGTICTYSALAAVAALGMSAASSDSQIMIAGVLLSFFMNGTYAGVYAYTPEVYPTNLRATGTGASSSIGRIGAMVAPIVVGLIYPSMGFGGVFGLTTALLLIACGAVLILGVSTTNRSLEEINEEETSTTTPATAGSHL